ncbi:sigma-54 interaction domain-containing protein [Bacillus seohaeanensis]|uniref:Sigma-54 interaction domain-containing protein n=1 Tax=Bacillus seohaeanensis TaxID=284580 RepID=A0ABW5RPS1_9BACI
MIDSEKRLFMFEKVAEHLDSGIHVIDSQGKTIIYNQKMMEIENMEIDDVLDKNLLDVFQFNTEEDSTLLQVIKTKVPTLNVKQTYFNNRGNEITTLNNTFPIFHGDQLLGAIEIAKDITKLEKVIRDNLHKRNNNLYTFDSILGSNSLLMEAVETAKRATRTVSPVLISGEIGTGKELFAQSIHNGSSRSSQPFISQNCAALPDELIESMLFGTKKSTFTESVEHPSLFDQAEGGTLLLDEISSLNMSLQAKLLQVLQEQSVQKSSNTTDKDSGVRIIATINEDPIDAIANGRLRKDLYYRLSVVSIFLPPLRERKQDIEELTRFFIDQFNHLFAMNIKGITSEVKEMFDNYDWPGNVRELEHVLEASFNLMEFEELIDFNHLPIQFRQKSDGGDTQGTDSDREGTDFLFQGGADIKPLEIFMEEAETYYIQKALRHHDFNITKTAKALSMSRQNLQYRIRKYGIERNKF